VLDILLGMLTTIGIVGAAIVLVFGCLFLALLVRAAIEVFKHM
jgi:hypothetical protein